MVKLVWRDLGSITEAPLGRSFGATVVCIWTKEMGLKYGGDDSAERKSENSEVGKDFV